MIPRLDTRALALKPILRQAIWREWEENGFFPCYAAVRPSGDPTFNFSDLLQTLGSRTDPFLRLAALFFWPFRVAQLLPSRPAGGLALPLPHNGLGTLRFNTFFTDTYFYTAIRRMVVDRSLEPGERQRWQAVLESLLQVAYENALPLERSGQVFSVFQFFPYRHLQMDPRSSGSRFLRWSGLAHIDPDADDTFVLLELLADPLILAARPEVELLLERPYWQLARYYQFRPNQGICPSVNYTGVDPAGGVSTWFSHRPIDAPDLVVNVNVLRSLLVNHVRWNLLRTPAAVDVLHRLIDFLHRNVASGLFRTNRGYSFYLPEFFVAMFARTWAVYQGLPLSVQARFDPLGRLDAIRREVLNYLLHEMDPDAKVLNPLDAALALAATLQLGCAASDDARRHLAGWLERLWVTYDNPTTPYPAYEVFKGKLPTHMIYGSAAITAALVYEALDLYETEQQGHV